MNPRTIQALWDCWCIISVVGIWPRYIEPRLLLETTLEIKFSNLPVELDGLKIVQISDLHLFGKTQDALLKKVHKKIAKLKPDLIFFCGDFLCEALLQQPEKMKWFFQQMQAPYGCFAILGNHDYSEPVSIDAQGNYCKVVGGKSPLLKAFSRFAETPKLTGKHLDSLEEIPPHPQLLELLNQTPFKILNNESVLVPIKGSYLNVCGLGEYMLNQMDPEKAFSTYNEKYPGLILLHNPDGFIKIKDFPGEIVLSGHTHGRQVNLPLLRDTFLVAEDKTLDKGLFRRNNKWIYVNRGLGGTFPFRWFSPPEILNLTLRKS